MITTKITADTIDPMNIKFSINPKFYDSNQFYVNNKFYTEDMLDYLLKEIREEKAAELEKDLEKIRIKEKKNKVKEAIASVKKVYFNKPYTIVLWSDNTKTVVKCDGEAYDPEKGLAMAFLKKQYGNLNYYYEIFKALLPEEEDE